MSIIANLKPVATRGLGRGLLLIQKHSPEILTGVGVVGVVAAGVMASRSTLKLKPILEDKNARLELVKSTDYNSDSEKNKDVTKVYLKTSYELTKLYGPSITLGLGSIACILGAHGIMRRRNVAMVAAYKGMEKAFTEYRERIAEELGEEREGDIYNDRQVEEIENKETGKKEKVKTGSIGLSPYAKFFDELSSQWERNPEYNLMFVKAQEAIFNNQLHQRGHVFLNEVYDAFDIPRTKEGSLVGWLKEGKDGFIDFGVFREVDGEVPLEKRMFVNGHEKAIRLDFNVDGLIYDKI